MPCTERLNTNRLYRRNAAVFATLAATSAVLHHYGRRIAPIPWHNSIRTGKMFVDELLEGHPERIRSVLGLRKHTFRQLVHELRHRTGVGSTRGITLEESVAITLHFLVTNNSVAQEAELFQRSPDTISQCVS
jgi:hypothetical protein